MYFEKNVERDRREALKADENYRLQVRREGRLVQGKTGSSPTDEERRCRGCECVCARVLWSGRPPRLRDRRFDGLRRKAPDDSLLRECDRLFVLLPCRRQA